MSRARTGGSPPGGGGGRSALAVSPTPPPPFSARRRPHEPSQLTGSESGSATPSTRYGSFPPGGNETPLSSSANSAPHSKLLEDALKNATANGTDANKKKTQRTRSGGVGFHRKWERSQERLLRVTRDGNSLDDDDGTGHETPGDEEDEEEDGGSESPLLEADDQVWNAGETASWGRRRAARNLRTARDLSAGHGHANQGPPSTGHEDKQWGVVKMELMARTWGKKGLFTIYAGSVFLALRLSLNGL